MHDLESFGGFFSESVSIMMDLLLLLSCVQVRRERNYVDMAELARLKKGAIDHEGDFIDMVSEHFIDYCKPLGIWVDRLRKVIFPNGGRWKRENRMFFLERSASSGLKRQQSLGGRLIDKVTIDV